ncbi:MAG: SemiSWEET family transporter [Rickettsiaceae bacterium]|nr:SemiSWEET family transporter [Rickettsiaceae bacterium]
MIISIIGFMAAFTSTISLIPQIYRTYKLKSSYDLSYLMLLNFFVTSVLWIIYGVMITSMVVWGTNVIMLIFSIILLFLKYIYD